VTVWKAREPGGLSRIGPAVLVPERWRPQALLLCAGIELVLAGGLAVTAHPAFRWGTVALFAISTYVLWELRRRRPDAGCGCFGEVSSAPVGLRSLARTMLLTAMAAGAALVVPQAGWQVTSGPWWIAAACGLAAVAVLSPELEESAARIRYRAPCEQRALPAAAALARLQSSAAWRSHRELLTATEPVDSWRELCWRFFAYPGRTSAGDPVDVVFAVYLSGRRPPIRTAVVDIEGRPLEESTLVLAKR
jgi:hypothetical protein